MHLIDLENRDLCFFTGIFSNISEENVTKLKALMEACLLQENLKDSKLVAQSGGYVFDINSPPPANFKFA
jgi:hypothetical protein